MIRKYLLPLLSIAGGLFAVWMTIQAAKPVIPAPPVADPPQPPYPQRISGAGIVEPLTRNIAIGTHVSGIVERVYVQVGSRVKAGDPLFSIDDRKQQAELRIRQTALSEARARLARLQAQPRPEEIPPAQARVKEAEATLADLRVQLQLVENIQDRRAISIEDLNRRRYAVEAGEARLLKAKADLALLEAGAWKADLEVARAEAERFQAEVQAAQVEIERLTVRAPVAGTILQVNIRPGEYAQSGTLPQPLILLGNIDHLLVRVDIDENDAWRFHPHSPATAFVRGNPELKVKLTYAYTEPYVVPKRSLTGDSTERVDTRVLQVVYRFRRSDLPVYPGQLMDVYIEDRSTIPETMEKTPSREKEKPK
jgi:HlyD family secretion protein